MVGIICLILGYPYRLHLGIDFGVVDLVHVGRMLVYLSLVFSITSAVKYMGLFVDAIDAKNKALENAETTASGSGGRVA
jgi:CDP-diacylglycerol--glycerol-3-phosphate 3-phosphatidyltransferase